jgi:hypothetical protein
MNHKGVHQSNGAGPAAPGQVRPHLATSGRTTARFGRNLARLGRTTADRSWPQPAVARPEPAATGHSQPQFAGLGPAAPLGAPAPTKYHVSGPRHQ